MFIGRKEELNYLNELYSSPRAEFIVLYGRRRIGKTETLTEFCKGKSGVFYSCREYTDSIQLKSFSEKMLSNSIPAAKYIKEFADWNSAFSAITELPGAQKKILVIDEFPYMCKGNSSIPSILQILWDEKLKNANVMLILCGSSMSFIEKELLAEKNPLYGRTTGIYKMQPLPFLDAVKFFPNYSDEDKLIAYSILGGIPHYLKQFDPDLSLAENVKRKILTKGTVLYSEVEFLLRQELREASVYNTIIEAVALGNTSFNAITTKTEIEKTKLSVYIKNLIDLGIVQREFSALTGTKERTNSNKGYYQLTDNFFRFWYSFAYRFLSDLERGDAEGIWRHIVKDNLHHFASKAFENVCIEHLFSLNKQNVLPFRAASVSRWWGKTTKTVQDKMLTTAEEIDIVAADIHENSFIICECKFTNAPFDLGQFKALKEKLNPKGEIYYYLFSLSGFTSALTELAKSDTAVKLITLSDILSGR